MKITVFGDESRIGALDGDRLVDLNRADPRIPVSLDAFIEGGKEVLDLARSAMSKAGGEQILRANDVRYRAPWPGKRIAMVGGNYADHLAYMNLNLSTGRATTIDGAYEEARQSGQWGFWKTAVELPDPSGDVPFPRYAKYLDYEGEVAIVIGKRGKNIKAHEINDYVWGVTLANDWSIRDAPVMKVGLPVSYNLAKNFDGSISLGPCLIVGELEPDNIDVETKVNGKVRQRYNSKDMIFNFGEILEFLSRDFTFVPGDIISGGTAIGTAADQTKPGIDGSKSLELFLKIGDVVEVSSSSIGSLRNKLV